MATVVGVYLTQVIVEDLLTRQALNAEAAHFWERYAANPESALPDTANMTAYMDGGASKSPPPQLLADLPDGYHEVATGGRNLLVHVSVLGDKTLMLAFEGDQVSDLAFYFGVLPLSIVLLMIYALLFVAFRWSQRAMSPLERLAERLETADLNQTGKTDLELDDLRRDADSEVLAMIDGLEHFIGRLDQALERERNFTRDAGHELRTPVAVFKGSLDLMEKNAAADSADLKALKRMRRTVQDMEVLLESLLLLARVESERLPVQRCDVNLLLEEQVDAFQNLAGQHDNSLILDEKARMTLECPPKLLEIVTQNLIRNALLYTEKGKVRVTVEDGALSVADSGAGMTQDQLDRVFDAFYRGEGSRGGGPKGHGLGLAIVRRIVDLMGWRLSLESTPGAGTTAKVEIRPERASGNRDLQASQ